ncbi:hypothetical protein C8J57DRAFT_1526352 [Mycena rebaudengoi]|nr:hypothetical protein C8J57DRAFT_1526352 [Mycena rebaudengoi]
MGFMYGDDKQAILRRKMGQRVVLYKSSQLKIYAASWTIQLVQKLVAITTRDKNSDVTDAAYLALDLFKEKGTVVKTSELQAEFMSPIRMEAVRRAAILQVNVEFQRRHRWGKDIIELDSPSANLVVLFPIPWHFATPAPLPVTSFDTTPGAFYRRHTKNIRMLRHVKLFQYRDTQMRALYRLYDAICMQDEVEMKHEALYIWCQHSWQLNA